jgi:hypothetical protein
LHVKSQVAPEQIGVAFGGVVQGAHAPLHSRNPELQVSPQLVPLHEAVPLLDGHGEHELPQELTLVLETHWLPHRWKPATHEKPHETPSQVGMALAGATHGVQLVPQVVVAESSTQAFEHTWRPGSQTHTPRPTSQLPG